MKQNFAEKYPELARDWDYKRNHPVKIENISETSRKIFSWKCASGHSYEASAKDRANGAGCPYDAGIMLPYKDTVADEGTT